MWVRLGAVVGGDRGERAIGPAVCIVLGALDGMILGGYDWSAVGPTDGDVGVSVGRSVEVLSGSLSGGDSRRFTTN